MENLDKLVALLGNDLEKGKKPTLSSDPILSLLDQYKSDVHQADESAQVPSSNIWEAIEEKITVQKSATIFSLRTLSYWAVAAMVIIGLGFASKWFTSDSNQTKTLAATESTYETISISNEAEVLLRSFSSVAELENSDDAYTLTLAGEAQFMVKKRKSKIFKIKTPQAALEVLGTTFTVKTDSLETIIYLVEGKVNVSTESGSSRIMMPNEALRISRDKGIEVLAFDSAEQFTSWTKHEIYLKSRTSISVVQELERHFGIKITYPISSTQETLSGVLQLESKEQALKDIARVLGGEFKKESETRYSWIKRE